MVTFQDGDRKLRHYVYCVTALKSNIISLGQLLEKGYDTHIKDHLLVIKIKVRKLVCKVELTKNRLFTLDIQSELVSCMKVVIKVTRGCGI